MQRLAELRTKWQITDEEAGHLDAPRSLVLQARLLGLGGLLPPDLTRTRVGTDVYLRRLWDLWWRERDRFFDCALARAVWHLHGLRPANHPERRLALAAAWASRLDIPRAFERWCAGEIPRAALAGSLLELLQAEPDEFWSWHWTLRSARLGSEQPMLGITRVTDLAMNVILPWLWSRAEEGDNRVLQKRLEERFLNWPAAEDNSVLRLARSRLLESAGPRLLPDAAAQQGLMQVVRDFCDHSNAVCDACKLPDTLREFQTL